MSQKKWFPAFTLTELLVVMAILGFLMTLSVAGIQFALRRSRDVQRQNIVVSLENALNSYYASNQAYPAEKGCATQTGWQACNYSIVDGMVNGTGSVANYVQGNWSWGPITANDADSIMYYYDTSSGTPLSFAVCVLTEDKGTTEVNPARGKYNGCFCKGPGANTFTAPAANNRCAGMHKANSE